MLALSVECFLKSIRTTTLWNGSLGVEVKHTNKTHDFISIFHKLEVNFTQDADWLKSEYFKYYSRSFKDDLELNKDVFNKKRYPYSHKGDIPYCKIPTTVDEILYGCKHENDIAVYEGSLEDVAKFLFDVLVPYINGGRS